MAIEETAESRLARTLFIVEATACEVHCLWCDNARDSQHRRFKSRTWEQINPGWLVTVGELALVPICVSTTWAKIDGHLVMFWEACSQVVDREQIDFWINDHFINTWNNGLPAKTNAMNFHHCLSAIDQANEVKCGD